MWQNKAKAFTLNVCLDVLRLHASDLCHGDVPTAGCDGEVRPCYGFYAFVPASVFVGLCDMKDQRRTCIVHQYVMWSQQSLTRGMSQC